MKYDIRPIQPKDNDRVKNIIKKVLEAYGCTGPGYAGSDLEVEDMYTAYQKERHLYLVVADSDDIVFGGAGIAPLQGGPDSTAELRKMYFDEQIRGLGLGKKLINQLTEHASNAFHFETCYLETVPQMKEAIRLYEKVGFSQTKQRLGETGHFNCATCYSKLI